MLEILIFPHNGNAVEALDCLGPEHRFMGFIDDSLDRQASKEAGRFLIHSRQALAMFPDAKVLAVPGSPSSFLSRSQVIQSLKIPAERFATIVHPSADISGRAVIGRNTLVMAGVVVTAKAAIEDHVCILPNSVIHHDSTIGAYTLIGSNVTVAGRVTIGENCYVGSGSQIINNVRIGARALVGLGATVIRDVPAGATAVGNPARCIRTEASRG